MERRYLMILENDKGEIYPDPEGMKKSPVACRRREGWICILRFTPCRWGWSQEVYERNPFARCVQD